MTTLPPTSIDQHCVLLNAALSDPEGWSIPPNSSTLHHPSGLNLDIDIIGEGCEEQYTIIRSQYTTQKLSGVESDTCVYVFSPSPHLHTFTVLKFNADHIRYFFPGRLHVGSNSYKHTMASTLCVFQNFLRLNFTPAGKRALQQVRSEAMALILMHHPEAAGHWSIDLVKKEARPEWSPSTRHLLFKLDTWQVDPLLDVGFPARPLSGEHGFEITHSLHVSMPTTAHARASLLCEVAKLSP